ncbi:MAG: anaerobic sulfite reductase subunit AsrB [Aminivibrio sp.]|jgi:anaerobic sulfite reductase subunit B
MTENLFRPFPAKITKITPETDLEFTMTVDCSATMAPGQFFQVSLPKIGEAPISISSWGDGWLQFTVRAVGRLTNALQDLREGENLFIRGPYGTGFPMDKLRGSDLVIVAGGSGVAPVRPLIRQAASGELPLKSLKVIAGFKNTESLLFTYETEEWRRAADLTITIDGPQEGWDGPVGLVTEHMKKLQLADPGDVQFVIVGPPVMMKFACAEARLLGAPEENIWVSFERLMSCGLGKCGHCKIDSTYICLEGPVLNFTKASRLID